LKQKFEELAAKWGSQSPLLGAKCDPQRCPYALTFIFLNSICRVFTPGD
jgi:hypothetical protein